jgi:hypothetical protein
MRGFGVGLILASITLFLPWKGVSTGYTRALVQKLPLHMDAFPVPFFISGGPVRLDYTLLQAAALLALCTGIGLLRRSSDVVVASTPHAWPR